MKYLTSLTILGLAAAPLAAAEKDWNFGDGGTSTQSNPSHTFDAIGDGQSTFTVTLTVTDENGCTDTTSETVTINEVPDPVIVDPTFSFVSCSGG